MKKLTILAIVFLLGACIPPDLVITGRPCPCPETFVCEEGFLGEMACIDDVCQFDFDGGVVFEDEECETEVW